MTDVVSLAAELLAIPSPTGTEGAVVDFVSKWLIARGWNVNLQEVTRGRSNIWASRGAKKGVTLSTHLDTVPRTFLRGSKGRGCSAAAPPTRRGLLPR